MRLGKNQWKNKTPLQQSHSEIQPSLRLNLKKNNYYRDKPGLIFTGYLPVVKTRAYFPGPGRIVQTLDSEAIQRINHYPIDHSRKYHNIP